MTNEQAKQEAIKKAYGEHWDKVSEFCDSDGWITNKWVAHGVSVGIDYEDAGFSFEKISCKQFNSSDNTWRLKSIYSILNNNGWIRIEPDGSNLPTDGKELYKVGKLYEDGYFRPHPNPVSLHILKTRFETGVINEYKPITPELPPVY